MTSRLEFETRILSQEWTDLSASNEGSVDLQKVALVQSAGWDVYVADAYMQIDGLPAHQIETELTRAVELACEEQLRRCPLWVSRSAVGEPSNDWLDTSAIKIEGGLQGGSIFLGWGNNAISNEIREDPKAWQSAVRGMVDAQVLWCNLYAVSVSTGDALQDIALSPPSEAKAAVRAIKTASEMTRALVLFDLGWDELATQIQGIRKVCAVELLKAWKATEMREQAGRRVSDLRTLAQEAIADRSRRYQALVEGILFALALTALVQTALAFAQTAFSGGVSEVPGGDAGLLAWIRATNLDLLLGVVTLGLLSIVTWVVWARRRVNE